LDKIDDILTILTPDDFNRAAMRVFRRQSIECQPYRDYLDLIGVDPARDVDNVDKIPFLPIELFKSQRVYCGKEEPETVFTSSATGGEGPSRHYVAHLADYERVYTRGFELFYDSPEKYTIFALLPSYLEREGSSLVSMTNGLIQRGLEHEKGGGFYLRNHTKLLADMAEKTAQKNGENSDTGNELKLLLGVSYALLDLAEELAEKGEKLPPKTIVMETGGMKGRRKEMLKSLMHSTLREAFGVETIHSEYGMAELMSQAYSHGAGIFRTPPWMRVVVRDLNDPFDVRPFRCNTNSYSKKNAPEKTNKIHRGGINIIDLANLWSCSFIQTQDVGSVAPDGSFTIDGRIARSDIRGCNLLVQ
jgi:hypothetical protein